METVPQRRKALGNPIPSNKGLPVAGLPSSGAYFSFSAHTVMMFNSVFVASSMSLAQIHSP